MRNNSLRIPCREPRYPIPTSILIIQVRLFASGQVGSALIVPGIWPDLQAALRTQAKNCEDLMAFDKAGAVICVLAGVP